MDLSIVFVNWNSLNYLRECIASIYEHTHGIAFEIIVVDNASPEGGVDTIKEQFPEVVLIKSTENLGFAGANNLGFRHSIGKCVLFLNPDTKLLNPAINILLQRLQSLPDAGIVGCKLLRGDLSVQTHSIMKFPSILNQVLESEYLQFRWPSFPLWNIAPLLSNKTEPVQVDVISGACTMIRREVFEKVGMYSEEYFMYAEDVDLCWKVAHAGYKNYYAGEGRVIHYGGKSSKPESAIRMQWTAIPRFCDKNRGRAYGLVFRAALIAAAICRLAVIKIACAFGDRFGQPANLRSTQAKWRTILNVLWTPSIPNRVSSGSQGAIQKGVSAP
jgi:hypothetical protein